jgi:hypothetical protein
VGGTTAGMAVGGKSNYRLTGPYNPRARRLITAGRQAPTWSRRPACMTGTIPLLSESRSIWPREFRVIAALSGPLDLINLAQVAMGTTDVMMMGWLGPDTLATGALGANLYFVALIFGIGLLNATSPMIARDIGRDPLAVGDVRGPCGKACGPPLSSLSHSGWRYGGASRSSSRWDRTRACPPWRATMSMRFSGRCCPRGGISCCDRSSARWSVPSGRFSVASSLSSSTQQPIGASCWDIVAAGHSG